MRWSRVLLVCSLLALAAVPTSAAAAQRMWVGFQDDPSFRWRGDRSFLLDRARDHNASIIRSTVYWTQVAPTRPADPANPFDSTYRFDDLDEFVRGATLRGMAVMLTIWGTPSWANGGRGQNRAPTRYQDLTNFARAVAARYSGRYPGLPFVQFYTVWNESNLGQFLSPQYNQRGKAVAPFIYARIYRAAYAGIKAGNPRALVGIGETSARGRDRFLGRPGLQETESPGRFAQLLSTVRPRLQFDAWSQHPYPTSLQQRPLATVRWPNVTLSQLQRFGQSLDEWFGRRNTPIWVTEYGYETRPQEPKGVTYAQQADYMRQAMTYLRNDPRVKVVIWFILRDDPTSTWQSGLIPEGGGEKPASNVFAGVARLVDARNPIVTVRAGVTNPAVRIPVFELEARDGVGAPVFSTTRAYVRGRLVGVSQPTGSIAIDGWVSMPVPVTTRSGVTYTVRFDMADSHGNKVFRTATVIAR